MMSPYTNPYIAQMQPQSQMQDLGGLTPVYQNIANQQAMQNAALAQQNQLTQQAGQTAQGGGMNPMALAQALRKDKMTPEQMNAKDVQMGGIGTYNPFTQYSISQQYGTDPYSQTSRMLAAQEAGMR
jgi:hypothetical protein